MTVDAIPPDSLASFVAEFQATAEEWARLEAEPKAANAVFLRNRARYRELRRSEEGRRAIAELMAHRSRRVRLLAATYSLAAYPAEATAVLQALIQQRGLTGNSARHTLQAFQEGTLNLD